MGPQVTQLSFDLPLLEAGDCSLDCGGGGGLCLSQKGLSQQGTLGLIVNGVHGIESAARGQCVYGGKRAK